MSTKEGLDGSVSNQEKNSAPSTETPLYINGTSILAFSQGVNFREFPTSVKEIFSGVRQPQDKWYRTAVLAASAAVGFGLSIAFVSLLDPQTPSLIKTVIDSVGRIP
ncbi:hypothetical protein HY383_03385 [Candidatus Daviesbacteria bacterium]|nr:hypothetical protein [Candidatus Daviesbacteria bacterium]